MSPVGPAPEIGTHKCYEPNEAECTLTKKEDLAADLGTELVETMDRARGRLEKSRLFVGQVVDLVALLLLAVARRTVR